MELKVFRCRLTRCATCILLAIFVLVTVCWHPTLWEMYVKESEVHMNRVYHDPVVRHKTDYGGIYHDYVTTVDLRIIVLTFNRPNSLTKCLNHLRDMELDGAATSLEIWIDRDKQNNIDQAVLEVASAFRWLRGPVNVWIHGKHVGLYGQWLYTWRPRLENGIPSGKELALILEDDVDVSKYAYRWVHQLNKTYFERDDISGYGLQDENAVISRGKYSMITPSPEQPIYLYRLPGTWGTAPHPKRWYEFQNWFEFIKHNATVRPYVEEAPLHTGWYKSFEKAETADTMWTMWFIYFTFHKNLFYIYSNLPKYTGNAGNSLSKNRREVGLHFHKSEVLAFTHVLEHWNDTFIDFPTKVNAYDFDGKLLRLNEA